MRCIRFAAVLAAVVASVSGASAQPCCDEALPTVIYGAPPLPYVPPSSGYVLDPSDSQGPIYVVNQGPVYAGPGIYSYPLYGGAEVYDFAIPTYSEGGYAYGDPYPYVNGGVGFVGGPAAGPGFRVIAGSGRPYGPHPRFAYRYRTMPTARVVRTPQKF